jgi:hypothetical protein
MLALCIRACCEDECIAQFDFMGGGAPYKALWGRQVRNTYVVEVRHCNLRTSFHELHVRLRDKALRWLRAATPLRLRVARRDLLRRRLLSAWTGLLSGTVMLDELLVLYTLF